MNPCERVHGYKKKAAASQINLGGLSRTIIRDARSIKPGGVSRRAWVPSATFDG